MSLDPLASRAFRLKVVKGWVSHASPRLSPEDLINDAFEGIDGSLNNFRAAVAAQPEKPFLGPSERDLVWCCPSEDFQKVGNTGLELLRALGTSWRDEDVVELSYPISVVEAVYKPCAIVAGANPSFRHTPVEEEFGRTIGGLREMIHLPLSVVDALVDGASLREWVGK